MKKRWSYLLNDNDKKSLTVYFIFRFLIIICMIRELFNGNFQNAALCVLSLFLLILPFFLEKKLKLKFPSILEIIIFIFIFAAEILGEINNFYGAIPYWDTILHTLNGFLCASVGFSLVYLLNEKSKSVQLSAVFVALVSFCFSMTIGVAWEFFEYGMDQIFDLDMQKDTIVDEIHSVLLDPQKSNDAVSIEKITKTIVISKDDAKSSTIDGYLDIGLNDTMADLLVNCIGAFVYSIFGYLYIINHEKYRFAEKFLTRKA